MIKRAVHQVIFTGLILLLATGKKANAQTSYPKTVDESLRSANIAITSTPQTAKIFVNDVEIGSGTIQLEVLYNECITVAVKEEGYITETRTYCKKNGQGQPPKSDYFKLQPDDSYTASIQSDIANNEIVLNIKQGRSKEEAWKIIVASISAKFAILERNDEKAGYLRTSWIGVNFSANTVRTRLIIKRSADEKLSYKVKFVSEYSGKAGTSFSADEEFTAFNRILKKYEGLVEEMTKKLNQ
jgi:hypothetical protein